MQKAIDISFQARQIESVMDSRSLTIQEVSTLCELAEQVASIAAESRFVAARKQWADINSLVKGTRPAVLCTVPGETWPELIPSKSLVVKDDYFRGIEIELRRRIYQATVIRDDDVITERIYVPILHSVTDWVPNRHRPYSGVAERAATFEPVITDPPGIEMLKMPQLSVDHQGSEILYEQTAEVLGNLLTVAKGTPFQAGAYHSTLGWGPSAIDVLCELRGLEQVLMDFYLNPGFIHDAMEFLKRGIIAMLKELESRELLFSNDNETIIGSGHTGFTNAFGGNETVVTVPLGQLWGFSQAQELAQVSPEMLADFIYPYQREIQELFGLNYYGCCEPNDEKFELIKEFIPNLRALAVSPWVKHESAVNAIGDSYVYSWKPNPSEMITTFDEQFIRSEIRRVFELTSDCIVAVALRDVETVYGEPTRLERWTDIAKDEAARIH